MSGRITVVGDALLDLTVQPGGPIRAGADVPGTIRAGPGGQGANLAVRLAWAGLDVELVCGAADDPAGALLTDALEAEGIAMRPVDVARTGSVVILLDERGERTMISDRAPFAAQAATALPDAIGWAVVSGYLLTEPAAGALAAAVAGRAGRRVLVGCAIPSGAEGSWMAAARALHPDLVIANRSEANALDLGPASLADVVIVVTETDGAVATHAGRVTHVEAPAAAAVDTTGAGDAFAAALIAALFGAPWPPNDADLRRGLAAAGDLARDVARTPGAQARVAGERVAMAR